LKILVMIWFLPTVVCLEVTWVCMEKQKSSKSGFAKKQCFPPSRNVWHKVSHPKILELSVCASIIYLQQFRRNLFWHYVAK
jgi:hypothetical protein